MWDTKTSIQNIYMLIFVHFTEFIHLTALAEDLTVSSLKCLSLILGSFIFALQLLHLQLATVMCYLGTQVLTDA